MNQKDHIAQDIASIVDTTLRHVAGEPIYKTPIARLTLFHSHTSTRPVPAFYEPSFCAIVQGAKAVKCGDRQITYGAGQYLVAGFDVPVIGAITGASKQEPYICVQLIFDRDVLLSMRDAMPAREPITPIGIAKTPHELLGAVARIVGLLDKPGDAIALAPLYEREILYRLLCGPFGAQLRKFAFHDDRTAPIERAINHLRDTYAQPFDIDDLLGVAGRSQSSLYRDFKDATGLSPLQFRTRLRLQEARRLMLAEGLGAADAGFAVGYDSPSQLNRDYRRLYGCPPGEDVAKLKEAASVKNHSHPD